MGRHCTVCVHERRDAIDALLVAADVSNREIARRYGLSYDAVRRHAQRHLSPALAAMRADAQVLEGAVLRDRIEGLIGRAERLLAAAEGEGRVQAALAAVRELRALLELLGKATGELNDRPQVTVNLMASEEWLAVRAALFAALSPYPEARTAVSGQLLQLEAGEDA